MKSLVGRVKHVIAPVYLVAPSVEDSRQTLKIILLSRSCYKRRAWASSRPVADSRRYVLSLSKNHLACYYS